MIFTLFEKLNKGNYRDQLESLQKIHQNEIPFDDLKTLINLSLLRLNNLKHLIKF